MDESTPVVAGRPIDPESGEVRVSVRNITKRYGSLHALRGVSLDLRAGEVVGLVGDNGAGKSTLVNIISGALAPTSGEILVDGQPVVLETPVDARRAGIETVYQDLALASDLSIWQNVFLGRERVVPGILGRIGWLDRKAMAERTREDMARTKIKIPSVNRRVSQLSGGQRQAVAVGRAVAWGSRVVLLDEPTAALGVEQQRQVAELVKTVADQGMAVLLISHNLPQVHEICDRIAVLFRGEIVANLNPEETGIDETVGWITGSAVVAKRLAGAHS